MARKKPTKRTAKPIVRRGSTSLAPTNSALLNNLQTLIREARAQVASSVNSALVLLYWEIGRRIRTGILGNKRARYGKEILPTASAKLVPEFGEGFSARMMQAASSGGAFAPSGTKSRPCSTSAPRCPASRRNSRSRN